MFPRLHEFPLVTCERCSLIVHISALTDVYSACAPRRLVSFVMTHQEKRQHWLKEGAIALGTGTLFGITSVAVGELYPIYDLRHGTRREWP